MSKQRGEITPLFEACQPRSDVIDGTLEEEQFAADLATVAHESDEAASVYRNTGEFFDTTYPTEGLTTLLSNLSGRFLRANGRDSHGYKSSILCLDTTFGGGKTHQLIASYHLATNPSEIGNLSKFVDKDQLASDYLDAVDEGLDANTAVFVGGHVDAQSARSSRSDPEAPDTNTMWGEIAYQLFGLEGYRQIESYDRDRDVPGTNTLKDLLDLSDQPSVVLIDEIAEYLEDTSSTTLEDATLASHTVSFMKKLLTTAAQDDSLTVIYSVADSAFTDEAEEVRGLVDELDQVVKRQQKILTPTGETEVGAVLQHRLFDEIDFDVGNDVAERYFHFYDQAPRQFPQEVHEDSYRTKLEREYPFHPSVIETLTEKIDTIPDFQRTRGALKLLGRAIHYLWNHQPTEYDRHLVRLYDLTPADDAPDGSIRATLNESLFEFVDLSAAVTADIYNRDETAHAQLEDEKWTEKGIPPIGSHITTTVLWNSLAFGEQASGIARSALNEAVGHPDISFDHYDNALKNLAGDDMNVACYYLYDEDQIRFKAEPNLIRIIDQRIQNTAEEKGRNRFEARLEREVGTGGFNIEMSPENPADVPDTSSRPTLCVMHMLTAPVKAQRGQETPVPDKIQELYEKTAAKHGGKVQNRSYKNYVLFLAPDSELLDNAVDQATRLEAIEDLRDDSQQTADLSDEQLQELREREDEARGLLGESVRNVYRHLYYVGDDGLTHVTITSVDAGGGTKLVDAVRATMEDMNRIIRDDDPPKGKVWFEQKLWQSQKKRMTTGALEAQFARKPGLPFLLSTKPLRKTIARMVSDHGYAYWDSETGTAYWNAQTQATNWNHDQPLPESPDVATSIADSQVKIGDEYELFESIDALLEQHGNEIEPPKATECDECGAELPKNSPHSLCEECRSKPAECRECGKTIEGTTKSDEPITCEECRSTGSEPWSKSTGSVSAKRAFSEIRSHAASQAGSDSTPGVSSLIVEIEGDEPFKHGSFIAKRSPLKSRSEDITVDLEYKSRASIGEGNANFSANFTGPLEAFTTLNQTPEGFSDRAGGQKRIELKFKWQVDKAESITDEEDDILADLSDDLDGTNITVRTQAKGPSDVEENKE
ncbi:ATP-binding protein [Halobellus ordinarius]|uniref:ATP-binding protein n=1 Tax=Halobellus ordinarius TaxID=3075120 RepID=UPI0028809A73|nr:DUF499 domain-containing protein [Halobellus sp. ZY16]